MIESLVSIIIPSYNYGHLIVETLESIVKQHYIHWECIIVDDGSSDHTAEVVADFMKRYPQYSIVFHQVENGGTSAAKNIGIELAKGEYLQFLDADDLLSAEKLSIQVGMAQQLNAGLVFSKAVFFVEEANGRKEIQRYPIGFLAIASLHGYELLKRQITNNILTINSPLVKRELVIAAGMFDRDLKNNEDWMLWFKVAMLQPHFIFDGDDRSLALIRVHGNSAMNNKQQMFLGEVVVREYMDQALSNWQKPDEKTQLKQLNLDLLALHEVRSLGISKGLRYILSSFAKNPVQGWPLLRKGMLKLSIRIYKNIR